MFFLFFCIFFFPFGLFAEFEGNTSWLPTPQRGTIISQKSLDSIQATEILLSNGLKVCIKPISNDSGEIFCQLFAVGGYSDQPEINFPSAMMAASIATESGLGTLSQTDLSRLFRDFPMDLTIKLEPFQRFIDASAMKENFDSILALIHLFFTDPHFTEKGLLKDILQTRESLNVRKSQCEELFDDYVILFNTQKMAVFASLQENDLEKINLKVAKRLFKRAFSHPENFTLVIVGDIKSKESLYPPLLKYIASIPKKSEEVPLISYPKSIAFPPGIKHDNFMCEANFHESLTRITFPLLLQINTHNNMNLLASACQVIETRLRNILRVSTGTTQGIDVGYEFPQYPLLGNCWITLQFRSSPSAIDAISTKIFSSLLDLIKKGPTDLELESAKLLIERSEEYWAKESVYWLSMLSNFYKWDFDPRLISEESMITQRLTSGQIRDFLSLSIDTEHYSLITKQTSIP